MKKIKLTDLENGVGDGVRLVNDDEVYRVADWRVLKNITASITVLHPNHATRGHIHAGEEEEYYVFLRGSGRMQLDKDHTPVVGGEVVAIPAKAFHRVYNEGEEDLVFFCVFETPEVPSGVRQEG
ncbi:cupin domain-containing protein [Planctomycetota bacterium]